MKILITGGAGFIGSELIRYALQNTDYSIINLDKFTYAGNLDSLSSIISDPRFNQIQGDICDLNVLDKVFNEYCPTCVMHLAAESHVDRSIEGSEEFIKTNILGTYRLLEKSRAYFQNLVAEKKDLFRFHHISTDEVYGDLESKDEQFSEKTPYAPSSPYSASKASSDHLVRAWYRTYKLPILITNSSNNYGPYQFPEKLIPHVILKALNGEEIPVYGDGLQVRDWLYVEDHVKALIKVLKKGKIGETYNIGGNNQERNIDVVLSICKILDNLVVDRPSGIKQFKELITYVDDRPGHDIKYAIDTSKIHKELGWSPEENFDSGLLKTVQWYLENKDWWHRVLSGDYRMNRIGEIK